MDENIDCLNPMWRNYVIFFMKYNKIRVKVEVDEKGEVQVITKRGENEYSRFIIPK